MTRRRQLLGLLVAACALAVALGVRPEWPDPRPREAEPYRYHAEWASYIAPEAVCPSSDTSERPIAARQQTMLCLLDYARVQQGLAPRTPSPQLMVSARRKALDIAHCRDFRHRACGKPVEATARKAGYRFPIGENIAWGTLTGGTPRAMLDAWLASPRHRANLLLPSWKEQGLAVVEVEGFLGEEEEAFVWVSQFGRGG